jgi:hypothetical protein
MNKGGNVSPEILEQYGIAKKDITNWSKVQVGVLNALHINEATLTRGEWSSLIRLRPELKETLVIDEDRLQKKEDVKNPLLVSLQTLNRLGITFRDLTNDEYSEIRDIVGNCPPELKIKVEMKKRVMSFPSDELKEAKVWFTDKKTRERKLVSLSEDTQKKYLNMMKKLKNDILMIEDENEFYYELLNVEGVLKKLEAYDTSSYALGSKQSVCSSIVGLWNNTPTYKKFLDKVVNRYREEMYIYSLKISINKRRINNNVRLSLTYDQAMEMYYKVEKEEPYSLKHLLISLYVLMPPLRDNWGCVLISDKRLPEAEEVKQDYYVIPEKKFYLSNQKDSGRKGLEIIRIPDKLDKIVTESLKKNPREYMITQFTEKVYEKSKCYADDSLSHKLLRCFGHGVNDFRRAYTTYIFDSPSISYSKKIEIMGSMLHKMDVTLEHYYFPSTKDQIV